MDSTCIFCKIIAGELPASTVFENDRVVAFLDIAPIVKGHTLVVPKGHTEDLSDTSPGALADVMAVVKQIAGAQRDGLGAKGVNVTQANGEVAGQVVPHIHFHVIPRFGAPGTTPELEQREYDSPDDMSLYADKLRKALAVE